MGMLRTYKELIHNTCFSAFVTPAYTLDANIADLEWTLHTVAKSEFGLERVPWERNEGKKALGMSWARWGRYSINPEHPYVERVPNTIVHEIAHCLFGHQHGRGPTWKHELEAESVSCLVMGWLGGDFVGHSACYIYGHHKNRRNDLLQLFRSTEHNILAHASTICRAIENVS